MWRTEAVSFLFAKAVETVECRSEEVGIRSCVLHVLNLRSVQGCGRRF